ncbi:MAG: ribosomal protein S18-alanine N-acetyltransferase [Gammaproteobacteria bacterium]|nr:ribosomal protein S18-alanine N-acetyltransferase [Gammaproteobacteria bacterium]
MSAILKDPHLQLYPMRLVDVDEVMALERRCYEFPWTSGIFTDCLAVGYCCWTCRLDEQILGYAVMSVAAGEAHILNVCVHPEYRGHGLGQRLLQRLLTLAGKHGADSVFLEVRASNLVALGLYRKTGFNEIGVRRGYYPVRGGREDAILLALSL